MSDAAADSGSRQSLFSQHPAQARLDAIEALLLLLAAGGSIQIAPGQIASLDKWIRDTEPIHGKEMGQEMLRLVAQLKNIAKRQENAA